MAHSIRNMSCSVYARELKPKLTNQKLAEITHEDLWALTDTIAARRISHRRSWLRNRTKRVSLGNRTRLEG